MYATTIFATLIAAVAALPHHGGESINVGDTCGNGNQIHCCNEEGARKMTSTELIDVSSLLRGGTCGNNPITVLAGQVPLGSKCPQNAVCCGKKMQTGLINLDCTNIIL